MDAVAVKRERPNLEGQDDDVVLRAASAERRVVVTNNVRHYAPLIEDFGMRGEPHFGVLFTSDATFPRSEAGVGLFVGALATFAQEAEDDDLMNSCMYLPRPA